MDSRQRRLHRRQLEKDREALSSTIMSAVEAHTKAVVAVAPSSKPPPWWSGPALAFGWLAMSLFLEYLFGLGKWWFSVGVAFFAIGFSHFWLTWYLGIGRRAKVVVAGAFLAVLLLPIAVETPKRSTAVISTSAEGSPETPTEIFYAADRADVIKRTEINITRIKSDRGEKFESSDQILTVDNYDPGTNGVGVLDIRFHGVRPDGSISPRPSPAVTPIKLENDCFVVLQQAGVMTLLVILDDRIRSMTIGALLMDPPEGTGRRFLIQNGCIGDPQMQFVREFIR